jgi:tRNA pseudouridine38-40 synthase
VQRYRATVEYDGTQYHGWQFQPGLTTVQAAIEASLMRLYGTPIRVHGAGRTDAGVHAQGQVIHFDANEKFAPDRLLAALNGTLPQDIKVRDIRRVSFAFHARFAACWRYYRYRIFRRDRALERMYGWHPRYRMEPAILPQLSVRLIGEHDFTAFSSPEMDGTDSDDINSRNCRIYAAGWEQTDEEIRFHIVGNRFLRHMVRGLVGTMVDVARGRFAGEDFIGMLTALQKVDEVFNAPPRGLCLMHVGYAAFPRLEPDSDAELVLPIAAA